ncbi:MAG TPA: radical SAM protein [Tenericutes bacterium]|nr:radical SAM protein [Mycoplasmatota bacterium]
MVKDLCIEIIEKCLNNCKFCSSNSNCNKTKNIEFEDFKRVIDYFIRQGGIEELSLSGGEPFLHPELIKMIQYAKTCGVRTVIFTSGVISERKISHEDKLQLENEMKRRLEEINQNEPDNEFLKEKIVKFYSDIIKIKEYSSIDRNILHILKEIGLDKIVFDMQAYEADTDSYIMGRNELARQSLLKSLIDSSLEGLNIDVHFVPMKPNYKEIIDILELLEIANVSQISLLNFLPQGRGRLNVIDLMLNEEEKREFFKLLDIGKNKFTGKIRIGIPLQGEENHRCNAGLEKLDIKFNGDVLPCPAFKEITLEECERFNIKIPNIYKNLEDINIPGKGKRVKQLCKQIYDTTIK